MLLVIICIIIILGLGIREKRSNDKNISQIPIRVNVNGIRGKSTATRLITGILTEAGYKTIGKTTGTAARMIYWDQEEEKAIVRGIQGANIKEQIKVIDEAAKLGVEALVCECMAVHPDYQAVYQEQMIQANVCVIVNVLEDHLDVMGPTLDQVAQAFSKTIPENGFLITVDGPYRQYFEEQAALKNTKVIIADNKKIPEGFLDKFDYTLFPDNVSLALAVAEALEIDPEIAFQGMLNAHPDPGAMRIHQIGQDSQNAYFVNGFAANEPASTMNLWEKVCEKDLPVKNPLIIFNGRPDRVDRTEQFVNDYFPKINDGILVGIGESIKSIRDAYEAGEFAGVSQYIDLEDQNIDEVMNVLMPLLKDRVVFGIGNIHGEGEHLIDALLNLTEYQTSISDKDIQNKPKLTMA